MGSRIKNVYGRIVSRPHFSLGIGGISLVGIVLLLSFAQTPDPQAESGTSLKGWAQALTVLLIFLFIISVFIYDKWNSRQKYARGDHRARLKRLTNALSESLNAIDAIRAEIEEGNEALERLKLETKTQKQLASLSEQEATAVRHLLEAELRKGRRGGLVRDVLLAIAGAIFGTFLTKIFG